MSALRVLVDRPHGYVGAAVSAALHRHGHHVHGLAATDEQAIELRRRGIEPVPGSLTDLDRLPAAVSVVDAVVHTRDDTAPEPPAVDQLLITTLTTLLPADATLLITSSTLVYGDTGPSAVTEDVPTTTLAHDRWRTDLETSARTARTDPPRTIILRPPMPHGRAAGMFAMMAERARHTGILSYPGVGNNRWSTVHVDDLAQLYPIALTKAPHRSTLNAASTETLTVGDIFTAIAATAGLPPPRALPLGEAIAAMGPGAVNLTLHQHIDSTAAYRLGWRPHHRTLVDELASPDTAPADPTQEQIS